MRRNPLFIFANLDSQGIYDVPLKSTVHIVNIGMNAKPIPMFLQLVAKVNLGPMSTIRDLINVPEDYIDLSTINQQYSELEKITEDHKTGWRILNRNPELYGNIGEGAFDFSNSTARSSALGAGGDYSAAWGSDTIAWGENSTANGNQTTAGFENQFVIGTRNLNNINNIFEVGVGDCSTLKNAFEITKAGVVSTPEMDPTDITNPKNLITKEYLENDFGGGQLLRFNEGNGNGYRIAGRLIDHYANVGFNAIDLSVSTEYGTTNGAMGENSFTTGLNVISPNQNAFVSGQYNDPKIDTILEVGNGAGIAPRIRSNAFEVYKDGGILAPSLEISKIVDPKSLITKEYLNSAGVALQKEDRDITDATEIYNFSIEADLESINVLVNGILLRESRDYDISSIFGGISISFVGKIYKLYLGDWLQIIASSPTY